MFGTGLVWMSEGGLGGFGDLRRCQVGARLLAAMRDAPTMCLNALLDDRNESRAFGRFLANRFVSRDEMLVHAGLLTGQRAAGRHVLAIQDTTELHFPGPAAGKRGFGTGGNGQAPGLFLHPAIAVDAANRGVIGLVGVQVINRTDGPVGNRRARDADAKESRRWLAAAETAAGVLEQAAMVTVVGDRESDIYDLFARRPEAVQVLCRAAQDRSLDGGARLFATCAAWPEQDRYVIEVPGRSTRPARTATVAVRFGQVTLQRPARAGQALAKTVTLRVVDVAEIDPPDPKEAVHWCLLTTHDVPDLEHARTVVGWYQARWTIEQVFRTLKSAGAEVETSQVVEAAGFLKLAIVALIAAVRIVQIVIGRDGSTRQALADAASPGDTDLLAALSTRLEGRTALLKNPYDCTTLAWFAWIVARLGGWSGYTSKGYKPPGPKTIARGLTKLDAITDGWHLNHSAHVRLP